MYRIEIVADTINELVGRLAALSAEFGEPRAVDRSPVTQGVTVFDPEGRTATEPRAAARGRAAAEAKVSEKIARGRPGKDAETPKTEPIDESGAGTEAEGTAEGTAEEAQVPKASPNGGALSFEDDIGPRVLRLVSAKGKPAAIDILAQFGVERASDLGEDMWPEFINALDDAIAV